MESITIKVEDNLAKEMDSAMKRDYTTKTEFIREAIRDKMRDLEKEEALIRVRKLYGASKRKTTDEERHKAGEKAFEDLEKELK